jgi:hypothetical protein
MARRPERHLLNLLKKILNLEKIDLYHSELSYYPPDSQKYAEIISRLLRHFVTPPRSEEGWCGE